MNSLLSVAYEIDPRSAVPSYRQLAALLQADIEAGAFNGPLPSITRLVQETGLAVMTVRRAIQVLADAGLVVVVPGRGTFVAERR
ncbi:MAG: GntR family transcriptional regulator [Actinomycetota bacterium]|nr:GntR family transcriptional regulator [Actinomycetota bacterium]